MLATFKSMKQWKNETSSKADNSSSYKYRTQKVVFKIDEYEYKSISITVWSYS
jgi:hypothetical protein